MASKTTYIALEGLCEMIETDRGLSRFALWGSLVNRRMIEWSYYVAFLLKHFLHPPVHVKRCYDSKQKKDWNLNRNHPYLNWGMLELES